jgi:uncharacterized membrane protein
MNEEIVFETSDIEKNHTTAILMAVIPILFFLPLVSDDMKNSCYLRFFANQTLLVLIASVGTNICGYILALIPILGWLLRLALSVLVLVLYIMNIVYAANGQGKKLPLIGGISIIK